MKESKELVKNLVSNTPEDPNEYVKRARALLAKREEDENELRKSISPVFGRDDRLSGELRKLDVKLRNDISDLRKEYNLE